MTSAMKGANTMPTLETETKTFEIDEQGFLVDPQKWEADFARAMAPELGIVGGLTDDPLVRHHIHPKPVHEDASMPHGP